MEPIEGENYIIAADLIERGLVSIDEATANMLGADILPLLKIWVEPDEDSSTNNNNNKQELVANWHHKQLNTFDPSWLQDFQDSTHQVLSTINLSQNALFSVPEGLLWGLQNLRRLNLSQNSIQRLPSPKSHRNLSECRLRSLSLYQNKLVSVPAELFMLEALEFLSLASNSITELIQPAKESIKHEIPRQWNCMSLVNLDLSQNRLSSLPRQMDACTSLITINLSENSFSEIPRPWACPLEILNIAKNKVQSAPGDLPKFWHRTLRFINLSNNRLTEIPAPICQLSSLSELDLSHNVLRCFPSPRTWSIRKLQHLNLAYNQLMHREAQPQTKQDNPKTSPVKKKKDNPPSSPTSPRQKQGVANFYTKLRAHKSPAKIIDANSRSTFYTHSPNGGSSHPEKWEKIEFPECFAHSLYVLKLSHNALEDVPPSICKLEALYDLDVSWNPDLQKLPEGLSTLKHLFHLKIEGLDIKIPSDISLLTPEQRCKSGQVLKILHEKLLDSQPYHSMKLMIMGPAKSGKTTLLGSLMNNTSGRVLDMALHVTEWELQDPVVEGKGCSLRERVKEKFSKEKELVEGPSITFFSWDMKGGDLYENVHQCFVTAKTLYLLVWDMSEGMDGAHKLSSLLLNISSRSSDFGIVIVGTHHDVVQNSAVDVMELRSQLVEMLDVGPGFPPVAGIVEVDSRGCKNHGMAELRRVIYETALQMKVHHKRPVCTEKLIGRKVPQPYFNLKKRISQEVEVRQKADPPILPIMTETELAQIVQLIPVSGLHTPEELQEAISFLHEIGSIVHFTDHLNGLNDLYFIDPVWLACTLQRVTALPAGSLKGGKVHVQTLRELSKKSRIGEDKFEQYLQLLARFEIVVPISHHWFLVPSRLPRDNPGLMISLRNTSAAPFYYLRRVYKMPYLPPGFWIRLVSRLIADLQMHDKKIKISPTRSERKICRSTSIKNSISKGIRFLQSESIYWREGIFFRHKTGQIMVQSTVFPSTDKSPGVDILISCQDGHFSAMGCVVDQIEGLIKDWYPGLCASIYDSIQPKVQRLVPCPICVNHGTDDYEATTENLPHCYTVEELVQRYVRGETHITACANSKEKLIPISVLIPDMFMEDLSIRHLKQEEFKLHMVSGQSLGQGGFGEVFRAKFRGQTVAAKTMFPSRLLKNQVFSSPSEGYASCSSTPSSTRNMTGESTSAYESCDSLEASMLMESFHKLRNEVAIMAKLDHPCIVNLVGVSVRHLCFAMDYAPLGDLQSYLFAEHQSARPHLVKQNIVLEPVLSRLLTYKISLQVASAVEFLHSKDIIYCDLKTDNILLFSSDVNQDVNIKLTDYGISRTYDLMGAMGMAGPPGFCAPEILQGKVFDEKVDWFSYGMFLYHLMTGLVPYHDQHSRIEIQLAVNEGRKPTFNFHEYTMPPSQVFPALGSLMESCWQDRPGDRPHGKTVLQLLSEPSFLCLRRVVEVDDDGVSMAFSPGTNNEAKVVHLVVDSGRGTSVKSFRVDEDGCYKSIRENALQCPMIKTALATPCGSKLVVGTVGDFVQVYHLPSSSQSSNASLLVEARVAGQPTSLLYLKQPNGHDHSLLLVGQANGTLTILSHETEESGHHATDALRPVTRMQLNKNNLPCSSMVAVSRKKNGDSVAERRRQYEKVVSNGRRYRSAQTNGQQEGSSDGSVPRETRGGRRSPGTRERTGSSEDGADGMEVWVGCGSNLRIILLNDTTLEPAEIQVAVGMEGMVEGIVHSPGSVWCYTSSALYVYRYCVETRKCLEILDCRETVLVQGSFLPLSQYERQDLFRSWEEKEKEQELANATAVSETNTNGDGRYVSAQEDSEQDELPIIDDHFRAACIAAPRRPTDQRVGGQRHGGKRGRTGMHRWNIHSTLASQSQSSIKVSSLLVMDHVLWIGRSNGDIVLVNIRDRQTSFDEKLDVEIGEVVTVLNAHAVLKSDSGRVVELHHSGPNRVVACHDRNKPGNNESQIKTMSVWEDWGYANVEHFQTINNQCRKVKRKSRTYLEV
ncbi:leucine-rich repeat serine/threonine-protein kinase 1-like isoform X2 [Lytechinus variegatus]|uniref:leucine-rich repeat serine/threonine-protein kinase 1-like isoform X2 n=1 Tax=Lytechinus variegatus TaxID=7654 RepID=UPI001BB13986|nr:leucine-rich repeat serine/threonine-protein kinase 1-like isoform X2 [Lytechinus variegatus]